MTEKAENESNFSNAVSAFRNIYRFVENIPAVELQIIHRYPQQKKETNQNQSNSHLKNPLFYPQRTAQAVNQLDLVQEDSHSPCKTHARKPSSFQTAAPVICHESVTCGGRRRRRRNDLYCVMCSCRTSRNNQSRGPNGEGAHMWCSFTIDFVFYCCSIAEGPFS